MDSLKTFIKDNAAKNVLFVLKGYDPVELDMPKVNISDYIGNGKEKLRRLIEIADSDVPLISFEEFILLFNNLVEVFDQINILENGIYYNIWPLGVALAEEVKNGLLIHYDRDADDNTEILDICQYTEIYSNFVDIDGTAYCNFNLRSENISNPKINIYRFTDNEEECFLTSLDRAVYYNICDQEDYIRLIICLERGNEKYNLSIENFVDSINELKQHLDFLASRYPDRIAYANVRHDNYRKECPDEIYSIMKRYWGYESFRTLNIYDMEYLQEQKKKVQTISQENIIADIIEQAENCISEHAMGSIRDIFVTAPTGAGKSLMFQLPAMYLAQKYNLLTIIVSPLIALMEDQVQNLERKGYYRAATINSDKPPIIKQEIYKKIMDNEIDLLYLSPESLLSRSDIEQLIGKRKIGLFVVDEAHIVTTWGKQFRPDYWFLGDHVYKLRRRQMNAENGCPFVITTFTATAIYGGIEDMYHETLNSLHMVDPITYLGYVRRENISIDVSTVEVVRAREEYEVNKFDEIYNIVDNALLRGQKVLVYFPTVALIERCRGYLVAVKNFREMVVCYGSLPADEKNENIAAFKNGEKLVMLATKAFGMGIDIADIAIVVHFAPTGNVCDYMQEIGRAARKESIEGHAVYKHMSNDFKHINRLHGMSTIRNYQLASVIGKIFDLYAEMRYYNSGLRQKKRNSMLIDANSFAYIFDDGRALDENDVINKVKTAMLLIQKDYERHGFAPFHMRPIPIFAYGYFAGTDSDIGILNRRFANVAKLVYNKENVYEIDLESIWESGYQNKYSFPQFKYLLFSADSELDLNRKIHLNPALKIEVELHENSKSEVEKGLGVFQQSIKESILTNTFIKKSELIERVASNGKFSKYMAENLTNVFIAAADVYRREISSRLNSRLYSSREMRDGEYGLGESYRFTNEMNDFFAWLRKSFQRIACAISDGVMYIVEKHGDKKTKETVTCLGVFEAMRALRFQTIGGLNSQLYIYVNETRQMQIVKNNPERYNNRLLELVNNRHIASVRMMTYLFQSGFTSEQIWDRLEDYFLGIAPNEA